MSSGLFVPNPASTRQMKSFVNNGAALDMGDYGYSSGRQGDDSEGDEDDQHDNDYAYGGGWERPVQGPGLSGGRYNDVGLRSSPESKESKIRAPLQFIASERFTGARPGYMFTTGDQGLGYYLDSTVTSNADSTLKYKDMNRMSNSSPNNSDLYDNEGVPKLVDEEGENDQVPSMPGDYYESVENFLKRPAPKIKEKGDKNRGGAQNIPNIQDFSSNHLPIIKAPTLSSLPHQPPQYSRTTSKIKSIITGRNESKTKEIDTNLLMQAFAYTEQLTMANLNDDDEYMNSQEGLKKGKGNQQINPNMGTYLGGNDDEFDEDDDMGGNMPPKNNSKKQLSTSAKKGAKKGKSGLVNKVRKQAASDLGSPADFNTNTIKQEEDPKRNALDFDGLLANFQQGLTLNKLRAELEESQRNLKSTSEQMKKLTRDTIQGRR